MLQKVHQKYMMIKRTMMTFQVFRALHQKDLGREAGRGNNEYAFSYFFFLNIK